MLVTISMVCWVDNFALEMGSTMPSTFMQGSFPATINKSDAFFVTINMSN